MIPGWTQDVFVFYTSPTMEFPPSQLSSLALALLAALVALYIRRLVVWKARTAELAAYGVTKCAENMVMTKYAALLEEEGFTVAAISPGNVDVSATAPAPREWARALVP